MTAVVGAMDLQAQSEGAAPRSPRRQSSDAADGGGYRAGEEGGGGGGDGGAELQTGMTTAASAGGVAGKTKTKKKKKKKKQSTGAAPGRPKEDTATRTGEVPPPPPPPPRQLPLVYDRLSYSEVLELGKAGKIGTIIKHPTMSLGGDRGRVFTVVEPERRVFRVVLPSGEDDPGFWKAWNELELGKKVESVQVKTTQPPPTKKEPRKKEGPIPWVPVSEGVLYGISILCMWLLYQVVVWQRKKKADYKERKRLEAMESEEREKMKQEEQDKEREIQEELVKKMEGMDQDKRKEVETVLSNADLSAAMRFMRSGAKVKAAGKSRAPKRYTVGGEHVKFSDCAGLGQIRYELEEVVDFFKNREKYISRGSRIPAGILLSGEPGVGKTLLAKAVAGEANVTFLAISASQFVEVYVGVGAARVRALYTEAKEQAPAVVFIDEIDAVGRKRGMAEGSGGEERDATLNQLLINLDGFEGKGDVITIAATNRVDILDEALVRPGRFDRKIYVPKPGPRQRAEILQVHARGKPLAENLNWQALGEISEGLAGAELAQAMNNAALIMLRKGRDKIREEDISEAVTLAGVGVEDPRPRSLERQRMLALHQASQLVLCYASPFTRDAIGAVNIVPRLGEKVGRMRIDLDPFLFLISGQSARFNLDYICVLLAPRAVDEVWNGADNLSTISMDFMEGARDLAMSMVMCGMSDNENLYGLMLCMYTRQEYWEIDNAVDDILEQAYARTMEIVRKNRSLIDALVDQLVTKSSLERREYLPLMEFYGNFDDIPNGTPKKQMTGGVGDVGEKQGLEEARLQDEAGEQKDNKMEKMTGALPS
ncbi:hypothetical protein CBR_g29689 [Chara braunii]|uniref:AAA+ ATPase domain-containing protein n=1 Tax=Chara braunii TaxID=69332 RepID=A0A388LBI3_CHABU|nr:hypothetical protein CBR_g29689 [Chara braunii]|eukprot:GBG79542.1 hypothetical protein CBR_g29689 [Chara braunii]